MERKDDREPQDQTTSEELIVRATSDMGSRGRRDAWMITLAQIRNAKPEDFKPTDWNGETI
jgi:hypothetical protein